MPKQTVLLEGATGESGSGILDGLVEDGSFDISCLIRPQSINKPTTQALKDRDLKILVLDLADDVGKIAEKIRPFHTIISAVGPSGLNSDHKLVEAAAIAGTKRFVPSAFGTVTPPGGVMGLRDEKEGLYAQIWRHHLPYTIIDVGFWYQISIPRVPSGKLDYAILAADNRIYGDGTSPNILIDKRDIGRIVARIIKDERTLNKKIFAAGDVLSQNEIWKIIEQKSGEKIETTKISADAVLEDLEKLKNKVAAGEMSFGYEIIMAQYGVSKYIRRDNTPENAKYLGYLDAHELYPDFKAIKFEQFIDEILAGKGKKPYADRQLI